MNVYPQGDLEASSATVRTLRDAGVDILAGSDVSEPLPMLGGLAHGASLHRELQLLVQAGFTPVEALGAATSVPARRFALADRGRIVPGARADLLLVDGDPTTLISDNLVHARGLATGRPVGRLIFGDESRVRFRRRGSRGRRPAQAAGRRPASCGAHSRAGSPSPTLRRR